MCSYQILCVLLSICIYYKYSRRLSECSASCHVLTDLNGTFVDFLKARRFVLLRNKCTDADKMRILLHNINNILNWRTDIVIDAYN